MTFEERIVPELLSGVDLYRSVGFAATPIFNAETLPPFREKVNAMFEAAMSSLPQNDRVTSTDHTVHGQDGEPDVVVRIYRPVQFGPKGPCLFWIHGGGMIMAEMSYDDPDCKAYAESVGCVVASVEYRLAPEHPYPAAILDCYTALSWVSENAEALGIDSSRIAVGGRSGGGCLAAATVLMARDRQGPPIAYQLLIYPMLDDRNNTSSANEFADIVTWGRHHNLSAWRAVLGESAGGPNVSPYAAPARAINFAKLPPTLIQVGELEVFRDENIDYGLRLLQAGVPCELHVYPGHYHGCDMFAPNAKCSEVMALERVSALRRALGCSF